MEALLPLAADEIIVNYSSMFQEPGDKKEYVVITKEHCVPLSLKEMPVKSGIIYRLFEEFRALRRSSGILPVL